MITESENGHRDYWCVEVPTACGVQLSDSYNKCSDISSESDVSIIPNRRRIRNAIFTQWGTCQTLFTVLKALTYFRIMEPSNPLVLSANLTTAGGTNRCTMVSELVLSTSLIFFRVRSSWVLPYCSLVPMYIYIYIYIYI